MFTVGRAPQFLADQLTLSQPGGPDMDVFATLR